MDNLTIQPFMTKGAILCINNKLTLVPLHAFKLDDGEIVFRIGASMLFFDAEGKFEGTEVRMSQTMSPAPGDAKELMQRAHKNMSQAPEQCYFGENTPGRMAETNSHDELSVEGG